MQFSMPKFLKIISIISFFPLFQQAHSTSYSFCDPKLHTETQQVLKEIYTSAPSIPSTVTKRITYFSQKFLNKPYALTALGEGHNGEFDQGPLYRFDAFDCQTYVETVLALALTQSPKQFKYCMRHIRYHQGQIGYVQRLHFTSPDWNSAHQQQGLLQDITASIVDQHQKSVALYAETTINQAGWYQHADLNRIRLCFAPEGLAQQRLQQLQQLGKTLPMKASKIAYLPIQALVTKDSNSQYLINQIPSGALIEIVRPNWDVTQIIGTHLNVSHMGFAIREGQDLYFYQASNLENKILKTLLVDYLISMLDKPTIQGINVQMILPSDFCQK
jgi:hypothetical protein